MGLKHIYTNEKESNMALQLNRTDRWLAGVCGGLASALKVESTIIRLAFIFSTLFAGIGIIPYIILWVVMAINTP